MKDAALKDHLGRVGIGADRDTGMGFARLLAKSWVVFCLVAGAHALRIALASGVPLASSAFAIGICVVLFTAMGLLFAGGFGAAGSPPGTPLIDPAQAGAFHSRLQ